MPSFNYSVKKGPNAVERGLIEAKNKDAAVETLLEQGYFILEICPHKLSVKERIKTVKLSLDDKIDFYQRLEAYIKSGLELLESLELIKEEGLNPALKKSIYKLSMSIRNGTSFSLAARNDIKVFDNIAIELIKAGEQTGDLPRSLKSIVAYYEDRKKIKNLIIEAFVYPAFLLLSSFVLISLLMIFVFPKLMQLFTDIGAEVPLLTRVVFAWVRLSRHMLGPILLLTSVFCMFNLKSSFRVKRNALIESIIWKNKKMKKLIVLIDSQRFASLMSTMLKSDLSLQDSLALCSGIVSSKKLKSEIAQIRENIIKGSLLSDSVSQTEFKDFITIPLLKLGEKTGDLATTFRRVSELTEQKINKLVSIISRILEPSLIIFVGILIGLMVISLILPIMNMSNLYL